MPRVLTEQRGEYPQFQADQAVINLGVGQPSPNLLPIAELGAAARVRLAPTADPLLLQYGALPGYRSFRHSLAAFLARGYRVPVDPDELVVTAGTSTALSLVAQVVSRSGDCLVCSDPTYFLARGIFDTQGLKVVGVPVDSGGMDVGRLQELLEGGLHVALVYCIPSYHNPCGVSLAPERAELLVELSERYGFVIVADEPYGLLHFTEAPPPCMARYDRGRGRVLSLGSFSKLLGPGLRLGWAHGGRKILERLLSHGALRSGGCLNPVVAALVHELIDCGFAERHVGRLRRVFEQRAARLTAALQAHLPELHFNPPAGGYFIWGSLPHGRDATRLLEAARVEGVAFTPGARCAIRAPVESCLRLCFAFYESEELEIAAVRLARAFAKPDAAGPPSGESRASR